jgi:hypothetical protein
MSHFPIEGTEIQRSCLTYSQSYSQEEEKGSELRFARFQFELSLEHLATSCHTQAKDSQLL